MKACPKCNTQYTDDTLSFCLNDGTPLVGSAIETPTVIYNESETVVRSKDAWQQSQPTQFVPQEYPLPQNAPGNPSPQKSSGGSKALLVVAAVVIGAIAVIGLLAAAGYMYFRSTGTEVASNVSNTKPSPSPTATISTPTPSATTTPAANKPSPAPSATPTPGPGLAPDATPTNFTSKRLTFPAGAFSANINDSLEVGEQRTYLVACKAGQTLETRVESGLPCVTFSNTGSGLRWVTHNGDNKVTIKNNCGNRSPFLVSVSVK